MKPYIFDEFFASGKEESISPFLEPGSRKFAKNLTLRSALLSALLLALAFALSFTHKSASNFALVFVYFLAGVPALIETIEDLKSLEINIDVLMTLAAFLSILIGAQLEGALLLVLFALSGAMEESVSSKAKSALHNLHEITPHFATVLNGDNSTYEKSVREIAIGTRVLIKAGDIIPLDGTVIDGISLVNTVHLTGESIPVSKKEGDTVQAGSRNLDGTLIITIERTSSESTLSRIVKLIEKAGESKPKLERFFDRFSKTYATSIIVLSALFALSFPFLFHMPFLGIEGSLYRALAFLIAASPCALIIATPTAYLSAISACARKGILLKGGITLDALASCHAIAFDKTGTLTTGNISVASFERLSGDYPEKDALALASALEERASHPIGAAIVAYAREKKCPPAQLSHFKSHPGLGLEALAPTGEKVQIGNSDFIQADAERGKDELQALLRVGDSLFTFRLKDEMREGIKETVADLKETYDLYMLTGDHKVHAAEVASAVGIANVHSNLRPDDKMALIAELSEKGRLAMVGDGINDAPALARADVGISMGQIGSDTAIEASDIVMLADDLSLLGWLGKKSKKTMRIVRENVILALCVILFATTPALLGFIPLWLAVILHEGGTVLVGLNSLRLLRN